MSAENAARKPFFGANWKMHKGPVATRDFVRRFRQAFGPREDRTVVFFPPSLSLATFLEERGDRTDLGVGVQDVHTETEGAHTGAISAPMAAEAGAAWGLAGHSERRREFGDTDGQVARKVRRLLEAGLRPVLCVGETLEEREDGRLGEVLKRQVSAVLKAVAEREREELVFAYEPVWAIGTGRTASPGDAKESHRVVREAIASWTDARRAEGAVVLYGGSVKPHNAAELLATPGVDGALVGGASLDPQDFARICRTG